MGLAVMAQGREVRGLPILGRTSQDLPMPDRQVRPDSPGPTGCQAGSLLQGRLVQLSLSWSSARRPQNEGGAPTSALLPTWAPKVSTPSWAPQADSSGLDRQPTESMAPRPQHSTRLGSIQTRVVAPGVPSLHPDYQNRLGQSSPQLAEAPPRPSGDKACVWPLWHHQPLGHPGQKAGSSLHGSQAPPELSSRSYSGLSTRPSPAWVLPLPGPGSPPASQAALSPSHALTPVGQPALSQMPVGPR